MIASLLLFIRTKVGIYVGYIVLALSILAGVPYSGKRAPRITELEQTLKAVRVRNDVEKSIGSASRADLNKLLKDDYRD